MGKWKMVRFTDVFVDVTSKAAKIPKENYLKHGEFQIIDQGQNEIAGYTNNDSGLFQDVPAIIFGDHTRILKYVGRPLFIGADGVKLLRCKLSNVDYRYLYYALCSIKIENTGYNRHFKWLKESEIPLPPLEEQKRIAKNLDLASEIVKGYKEQLAELDKLVQSVFYEMFGDPVINEKGWKKQSWKLVFNTTTGKLDSNAMVENGEYPFFTCAKEQFWIDEYAFDCEALLLAGNNAAGIYDIKYYNGKFNAYQRTYVLTLKNNTYSYRLFKFQLESKLQLLKQQSKGTNTRYLTLGILNELDFIIPPLPLQICFASIVAEIEAQKSQVQTALEQAQNLFNSLMQEYFE